MIFFVQHLWYNIFRITFMILYDMNYKLQQKYNITDIYIQKHSLIIESTLYITTRNFETVIEKAFITSQILSFYYILAHQVMKILALHFHSPSNILQVTKPQHESRERRRKTVYCSILFARKYFRQRKKAKPPYWLRRDTHGVFYW